VVEIILIFLSYYSSRIYYKTFPGFILYTIMIIGCNRGPPSFFFSGKKLLMMLKRRPASARWRGQSRAVAGVRLEPVH
jgi:hypothetical protein